MLKIHFDKELNFPRSAFWSLTAYAVDNFKPASSINSVSINKNMLQYNYDGSLDLFIQPGDPGPGKQHNWLRTPSGDVFVVMRVSMQAVTDAINSIEAVAAGEHVNAGVNHIEYLE